MIMTDIDQLDDAMNKLSRVNEITPPDIESEEEKCPDCGQLFSDCAENGCDYLVDDEEFEDMLLNPECGEDY